MYIEVQCPKHNECKHEGRCKHSSIHIDRGMSCKINYGGACPSCVDVKDVKQIKFEVPY